MFNGKVFTLETEVYYIPVSMIWLYLPQTYFWEAGDGQLVIIPSWPILHPSLTLSDFCFNVDISNNCPMMPQFFRFTAHSPKCSDVWRAIQSEKYCFTQSIGFKITINAQACKGHINIWYKSLNNTIDDSQSNGNELFSSKNSLIYSKGEYTVWI